MNPVAWLLVLAGLFALVGAILDRDWYMNHARADVVKILLGGRRNARLFYMLLGIGLMVTGVLAMVGTIDLSR